jgi:hypothetical protein
LSVLVALVICALSMLSLGCWAFPAPHACAELIAHPPFNERLVHGAGAFQIGIGVATLVATVWSDAVLVALTGFVVASGLHTLSHGMDRHLGGHAADVPAPKMMVATGSAAWAAMAAASLSSASARSWRPVMVSSTPLAPSGPGSSNGPARAIGAA